MALFEIIIELPVGLDVAALAVAAGKAGYADATVTETHTASLFSVMVSHQKSSFETGNTLADELLRYLPSQSRYHSHRSSVSINEMSPDELDILLHEIESATYGQAS